MLLPALCVLALAAAGLCAPRHNTDNDYIDQLLRDELREEYGNHLSQRQTREDFEHFHDTDDYEQAAEQSQQPQSSNMEQGAVEQFHQNNDQEQNGAIEQFDQNNDQGQNGAIEQFDQNDDQEQNGAIKFDQNNDQGQNGAIEQFDQNNDQEQNGAIEQFDQNDDQEQNGAIKFDQNNDQGQNGAIEQFDQNNDQGQNGAIEQIDDDYQVDKSTDQVSDNDDQGIEHQGDQASGDSGRESGSSREQDRIHKEAIDRLFGSDNTDEFRVQEDKHFNDVFGKQPGVAQEDPIYPVTYPPQEENYPVTKRPSWFHRTWSNTKQKAKHFKEKVGGFFRGLTASVG